MVEHIHVLLTFFEKKSWGSEGLRAWSPGLPSFRQSWGTISGLLLPETEFPLVLHSFSRNEPPGSVQVHCTCPWPSLCAQGQLAFFGQSTTIQAVVPRGGGRFWMRVGKSWHKPILQKKEVKDWVGMCGSSSRKNVVSLNQTFLLHFWKRLRIWGRGIPPMPRQWSPHSSVVALEGLFVGAWGRKGQWESYCLYFGTTFMPVTWDFLIVLSLRNPIFTSRDLAPSSLSK